MLKNPLIILFPLTHSIPLALISVRGTLPQPGLRAQTRRSLKQTRMPMYPPTRAPYAQLGICLSAACFNHIRVVVDLAANCSPAHVRRSYNILLTLNSVTICPLTIFPPFCHFAQKQEFVNLVQART